MLNADSIVQRNLEMISADADQEIVMVCVSKGFYYGVAHVARDIWLMLAEPKKISELVGRLMDQYEVDASSCERDTLDFLERLLDEGLIKVSDESPA